MAIAARALTIFSLIVTLVALGATDASASHAWSSYHWGRTANPLALTLGDNVSGTWDAHLATASADWSSTVYDGKTDPQTGLVVANPLRTSIVPGGTAPRKCRATSGRVEVCNATYGSNGWLGLAQIWLSGGHIVQGVAKMNDTYFNTEKYNNGNEKLHVMCQEIGHTFGLGHTSENGSSQNTCMDYFSNTGANAGSTQSTRPNLHDYGQLTAMYSHLDTVNTAKSPASGAARGVGGPTGADGDGTPAGASRARGSWYVEHLGGGRYLITHIRWLD